MKKQITFTLSDGRIATIEVGEVMTNMVIVTMDDELIPASLFVQTYELAQCEDEVLSTSIFFHPVDEIDETLYDEFNLDDSDIALITKNIVSMGDILVSAMSVMVV